MKAFDYSLVKDPQYFKDGRMDAHSDHTYYRDGEEAQEKETSFRYDLNGIWKFHYARVELRLFSFGKVSDLQTPFTVEIVFFAFESVTINNSQHCKQKYK